MDITFRHISSQNTTFQTVTQPENVPVVKLVLNFYEPAEKRWLS